MSTISSSVLVLIAIGAPTVFANLGRGHGSARVVSYVWIGFLAAGAVLLGFSVLVILALSAAQHQALNAHLPLAVFVGAAVVLTLMVPVSMAAVFTPAVRLGLARR